MKSYIINVVGKVQGVGFRYFSLTLALKYNLYGYAKNLDNGSVEIFIQGNDDYINLFLAEIITGNRFIHVDSYTKIETENNPKLKKFNITY